MAHAILWCILITAICCAESVIVKLTPTVQTVCSLDSCYMHQNTAMVIVTAVGASATFKNKLRGNHSL
jgi:hypothetical protein